MTQKLSITIGREFGSGGHEIGMRVGELLGFRVYDKELLSMAAEKQGMNTDTLRRVEEKAANSLLYTLALGSSLYGVRNFGMDVPINDQLFLTQTEIIQAAAEEESCVFVGRCADYVLRNRENVIRVFVYADRESRIARVCDKLGLSRDEAIAKIQKTDKSRVTYYNFYTGKKWGKFENYDLSVNSALLGTEGTAQMIADIAKIYLQNQGKKA